MQTGPVKQSLHIQRVKQLETGITLGEVIDTNDPLQQGRVRVLCPAFGDSASMLVSNIPWAMYASPFAGSNEFGARGRGEDQTDGIVAYGMFNIPKVGAQVLVACIDGDPSKRVWFAALYRPYTTHTLPHGRHISEGVGEGKPEGPLSSSESPINPLYTNQTEAFSGGSAPPRQSFEWRTRGADSQASYLKNEYIGGTDGSQVSQVADDRGVTITEPDGNTITSNQGYGKSRLEPYLEDQTTDGINWDPQTYSWTTPGFHSIAMNDRKDNCRIRFRTTGGTQIILDDTNERIYISTAKGKSYVEIDEQGPIAIYTEQDFSVSAGADINFSTKGTFRVQADKGIHLSTSLGDIRATSGQNVHVRSSGEMHIQTAGTLHLLSSDEIFITSSSNLNLSSGSNAFLSASSNLHLKGGGTLNAQAGSTMNLLAGGMLLATGSQIHMNGPSASSATPATAATAAFEAFLTSMVPQHEPFARTYMKLLADQDSGNTQQPEYQYNDPQVGTGSAERNINLSRNPQWHR